MSASSTPLPEKPTDAGRPRRRRPGRNLGLWLIGVPLVLLVAVAVSELAGWPFLRPWLQAHIASRLGVPVRVEAPFVLHLVGRPRIRAERLWIGSAEGFGVPHLVDAEGLSLRWNWSEVLAHQAGTPLPVQALRARSLDVNLVRRSDGLANWQGPHAKAVAEPVTGARPSSALPVHVRWLAVNAGRATWRDEPWQIALDAKAHSQEGSRDGATTARFEMGAEGTWLGQRLILHAESQGLLPLLGGADAPESPVPLQVQVRIGEVEANFRGVAARLLDDRDVRGALLLRGPSLAALGRPLRVPLLESPPFRLAAAVRHVDGQWALDTDDARIGGSHLAAGVTLDTGASPPTLRGRIGGPRLRLRDLGPAVGTASSRAADPLPPVFDADDAQAMARAADARTPPSRPVNSAAHRRDRVLPDRTFDLPSLRGLDADLQLSIGALELGPAEAIVPLHQLQSHLTLRGGVLTLADLQASVAGGRVAGTTGLDASDPARAARWHADLRFTDLRIERWLPVLQKPISDRAAANHPLLSGKLDARLDVQGRGRSTAEILSTLQGKAGARLREGRISHLVLELAGIDVAQSLGVWLRGDRPLPLQCARAMLQIDQGVAVVRQALLDSSDSRLRAEGRIDLRDETLALKARVEPKDFSPFSLRAPLVVGGTLAAPLVGIEGRRLLPRLAASAALALAAPVAALLPLLDFGVDGEPEACGR